MSANRYRDASQIAAEDGEAIELAAMALCEALGIDATGKIGRTYLRQARVLCVALLMFYDRNQEVHDAWRGVGFLGNLMTLHGKSLRLMNGLWWKAKEAGQRSEKPLDNAIDMINYAAFFIRSFMAGDERGGPSGGKDA